MRRPLMVLGLLLAAGLAALWATGALAGLEASLRDGQRAAQNALAGAVRALRGGEAGALAGLMAVAFGYGVLHAAGPGHGKVLIGGYGVAQRVPVLRLAGIALVASLAQATVAVALVYAGVWLLGWTRERLVGVTEDLLAPVSYAAIAAIGLWLVWRGVAHLRQGAPGHHHDHHDHHHHDAHCGYAHGPTLTEVQASRSLRDTAALVAGIAVRPCTGALFLLILTHAMGIGLAGVAGAYAMGLGTALVTVGVAVLSVWAREGALASLPGTGIARALPVFEVGAGLVVTLIALQLLAAAF